MSLDASELRESSPPDEGGKIAKNMAMIDIAIVIAIIIIIIAIVTLIVRYLHRAVRTPSEPVTRRGATTTGA